MTNSEIAPSGVAAESELELSFTDLLANGQAVARASGLVVFCFGPLPGERARVRISSRKATYAVAEMLELTDASPDRAEPFCPVFGTCGGCQVQHLSYESQLHWKRNLVRNALERIGGITAPDVRETIGTAVPRAYRNKMSLVVEHREGRSIVGFYRARSHDVVPIDACPVVSAQLSEYVGSFAHASARSALGAVLEDARHLIARRSSAGEAVIAVTTERESPAIARASAKALADLPGSVGLVNSYEPASANAVIGRRAKVVAGRAEIEERIGGIHYRFSTRSFFQINVEIVERIFEVLERELPDARNVVDLYCGMGTFTLLFARLGAHVVGVEENRHAAEEARENAALNALEGKASFEAQPVERWARSPRGESALRESDLVFLDPPRKGSDEATLRAIVSAKSRRVAYVSCDPATLARDLRSLLANGYALRCVQPFDMFPHTGHVETLVILEHHD